MMDNAKADWLYFFVLHFLVEIGSESDLLLEDCCEELSKVFDL